MRFLQMTILSFLPWAVFVFHPAQAWQNQSRSEDSEHFYYLGISSPSSEKRSAFEEAYWMAVRSLMSEHFGVELNLHEQIFADSTQTQMNQQILLEGSSVRLNGLRINNEDWQKKKNLWVARVQLAYSKVELAKEVSRQKSNPSSADSNLNRHRGLSLSGSSAELFVKTDPMGAEVLLNQEMIGKTELHAAQLEEGVYDLEIRKKDFESYKTRVILLGGSPSKIDVRLKRAQGQVEFSTFPTGAHIEIEGENFKRSKAKKRMKLPAGRYLAYVSHPNYVTKTESFQVQSNRESFIQFRLESKEREKETLRLGPIDNKVSVLIRTNSSPLTLVFFSPDLFTTFKNITDNKTLRVDSNYSLVQATDSMGRELFAELIRDGDKIRPLVFDFSHYKKILRPSGDYYYRVQVYSDLYPARIQFFDPKKIGSFEEVKWQGATVSLRQPFLFYRAFGPNGETAYGYVDYRLTPWRVVLRFNSKETTKRIQSMESLKLFALILGAVALGVGAIVIGVKTEPKD